MPTNFPVYNPGDTFQTSTYNLIKNAINNLETGNTFCVTSTGTANLYVVDLSPALTNYVLGNIVAFKANFTNTGPVTINVNSLGSQNVYKQVNQYLDANDINTGQIVVLYYDGTNFQYTGSTYIINCGVY